MNPLLELHPAQPRTLPDCAGCGRTIHGKARPGPTCEPCHALTARAELDQLAAQLADTAQARRANWRQHAACRGIGPGLFYAPYRERPGARAAREAQALAVCAACPVRAECAAEHAALPAGEAAWGIWAGRPEPARNRSPERPAKPTKRCPTCGANWPLTAYGPNRSRPDGLHSECRHCARDRTRRWVQRRRNAS